MAVSITDYPSLLEGFGQYVERSDLQGYAQKYIQLTEGRLNRALRVRDMEKTAPVAMAADGTGDIPADYLEWIAATWTAPGGDLPARTLGLRFVESNSPEITYRFRPSGDPQYYAILSGKVFIKPPRPGAVALSYYGRISPLTAEAPVNWLVTRAPEIYLYGMLAESYVFQKDEERAAGFLKLAEDRLQAFLAEADVQKVGRRQLRAAEDAADQAARNSSR